MEKTSPAVKMQQSSSNPQILMASDDNAMIKKIQATHGPENHEINLKALLHVIEVTMDLCFSKPDQIYPRYQLEPFSDKNLGSTCEYLAYKINSIACEILGNCSGGHDTQETVLEIFSALSPFKWNAKGMIALAAFAVNYGEVCLILQIHNTDPIAKSLAAIEQLAEVLSHFEKSTMKLNMDALIKELLNLNKCISEFKDLPEKYIKSDAPEVVNAEVQFPTAIYWTIRSIVICQSQIINLTGAGYEYIESATEAWELPSLVVKVKELCSCLQEQLKLCHQRVEKNRVKELYQKIVELFENTHDDNTEILKILISSPKDVLYNGVDRPKASAESFKKKTVLLYISGLEPSPAELSHLIKINRDPRERSADFDGKYDIIWLPVVDKPLNDSQLTLYLAIQDKMPWFSPLSTSLIDTAVIEYIKNVWHFEKTSMIVALDEKAKVVNSNALHMMLIWGDEAYPFSGTREEQLWAAETWRLELLVDSIERSITRWINEGKCICLYGGEDMEWIRKFTTTANSVAQSLHIKFEIIYMGTSNPKEKVKSNNATIKAEKLSRVVEDLDQIWLFWFRLESMWHSRVQRGMSPETDRIIQETFVMHSFDCSGRGWAIISNGSDEMAKGMGDTMLKCLTEFDEWKKHVAKKGFVNALNEHILDQATNLEGCNRLSWPETAGVPQEMVCFECGGLMKKTITFTCCGH